MSCSGGAAACGSRLLDFYSPYRLSTPQIHHLDMALRPNYKRYVLSIQYHGSAFLGFAYQGKDREDCILADGTDLRGYVSVEGRLRQALDSMVTRDCYTNLQVSSRTDRGVHAIHNTLHVDLRDDVSIQDPHSIHRALNYFLGRHTYPHIYDDNDDESSSNENPNNRLRRIDKATQVYRDGYWIPQYPPANLRVLRVLPAPTTGLANPWGHAQYGQAATIDWNARYSAIDRTYQYRILYGGHHDWAAPFEWDRALRIPQTTLDIPAMRQTATDHFIGEHDYSSFRAARCQQKSPLVHVRDVTLLDAPYSLWGTLTPPPASPSLRLLTIQIRADSFVYRQVRNMVGCLLQVGRGALQPPDVRELREARDRSQARYMMAPAHGLFLQHVRHQGIANSDLL